MLNWQFIKRIYYHSLLLLKLSEFTGFGGEEHLSSYKKATYSPDFYQPRLSKILIKFIKLFFFLPGTTIVIKNLTIIIAYSLS